MARINAAAVEAAASACAALIKFERPADRVLSEFLRAHPALGAGDRAFVAETVYAVLRRKRFLEHVAQTDRARRMVLAALVAIEGRSVRELDGMLSRTDVEWLQEVKARASQFDRSAVAPGVALDLPDWLVERLSSRFEPSALAALAKSLAEPAPLDLRVNVQKATREAVLERLVAEGFQAVATDLAPNGVRLRGRPVLGRHPLMLDGSIEVQDEGSQLICHLVAPRRGEMVVDFCAGAGGKTLALGAMMRSSGRIYAFDVSEKRLDKLKPRLARSGLSNVHPQWIDTERDPRIGRLAGKIDRVLVDAPCSGLGTLRRNPDLKWRQQPNDVAELVVKQTAILASAARLLKPGGRLVYATCSILDEENGAIVDAFLTAHPAFGVVPAAPILAAQQITMSATEDGSSSPYLVLDPHRHHTDGFFAAVLERRIDPPA